MKLYVDFDNTIMESNESVVRMLNKKFNLNKDYTKLKRYDFKDLFPECTDKDITECFNKKDVYEKAFPYKYSLKVLKSVKDNLNIPINIVTIGSKINLINKEEFMRNLFNFEYSFYGITDKNNSDKSSVDMSDGIFIDDNIECLLSSNAKIKVLFKTFENGEWNSVKENEENIWVVSNWNDIYEIVSFVNKNKNKEIFK